MAMKCPLTPFCGPLLKSFEVQILTPLFTVPQKKHKLLLFPFGHCTGMKIQELKCDLRQKGIPIFRVRHVSMFHINIYWECLGSYFPLEELFMTPFQRGSSSTQIPTWGIRATLELLLLVERGVVLRKGDWIWLCPILPIDVVVEMNRACAAEFVSNFRCACGKVLGGGGRLICCGSDGFGGCGHFLLGIRAAHWCISGQSAWDVVPWLVWGSIAP